jgi:hypothetical protein
MFPGSLEGAVTKRGCENVPTTCSWSACERA